MYQLVISFSHFLKTFSADYSVAMTSKKLYNSYFNVKEVPKTTRITEQKQEFPNKLRAFKVRKKTEICYICQVLVFSV